MKKDPQVKQVQMCYRSETGGMLSLPGGSQALCWVQGRHGWHLEIMTYFPEEHCCQISSRSVLKQWSPRLFWRGRP